MDNKAIAREFKLLSQLLEFHGENSFKIRAIATVADKLRKLPFDITSKTHEELSEVPGIGKSSALKIKEILDNGSLKELEDLIQQSPPGIIALLKIKGIGPKKLAVIWQELGIDNLGELWYACKDDKISKLKGFGQKTQDELKSIVEFTMENQDKFRYADIEPFANDILHSLKKHLKEESLVSFTGPLRRCCEILETIDILASSTKDELIKWVNQSNIITDIKESDNQLQGTHQSGIKTIIHCSNKESFYARLIETTGNENHLKGLEEKLNIEIPSLESEEAIYKKAGLSFIPPELREGLNEIELASQNNIPKLIEYSDFKGSLHNHSLWSDGVFSIEDMAIYSRDILKLEYFGISDHSKTAVYANGLSTDRVIAQWKEIDSLNKKLAPFKILKGIESDILSNGSLDYPNEILAEFDFVVASIHAQLSMDEKKATTRLIKAIENPYTTILGHPTGRQLLVRRGYPIDHKKVIDACAANDVIIEINANPLRLDIDWRWVPYCLEKGVTLSINPDAHHASELNYLRYGQLVARKGGLSAENCLNCLSLEKIELQLKARKDKNQGI
ncbi:DNA polymerase/3'-5' exonuclease PolX [Albibacterium bauzanense]|uniref:DNA polymerase (Family 10) n=1 Tax=Albibacterium bauzanense TaxID=653929 RepID=A0A4R1M127_9SPHI|nr:DNA polymerase/3'-5' exonuclease PolX [Albibacterium bauzanense]TCK85628.1 DNA polymerase (family 10) [Albibacterium bauzanense]